jgi:uncharacterized protein YndB with AHSA1/START domain
MIDVTKQISAVRRQLGTRTLEAGEAWVQTISQVYDSTVGDVWDACTNPERIPRWFMPVTGDLRLGGKYQLEGNAGGTIERCDPPKSFAATWEYGGQVSWIEVRLTEDPDGGTRFELEHTAHVDDEHWEQFGPGATGVGWDMGFMGLAQYLSGAPAVGPAEAEAWLASDEGKEFVVQSSSRWRDAHIAAGEDADVAQARADRTTAAYTAGE